MLIRNLELKNFGIHRDLKFNPDGNAVVGLLGKNGAGKSTILNALRYAYTGELDDTIESMATYGQSKGYVQVDFEKDGKQGSIKREVGKTPKRELVWEGEKCTSVREVDNKLSEILGVDKKAFSNACFLKQGSLNELLFGTESNREQLFIKLVNLSYMDKFCSVVDSKIKSLMSGMEDLTAIKDEVTQQKSEELDRLAERNNILKECKNAGSARIILQELKDLCITSDELKRSRLIFQQSLHENQERLNTILAGYKVASTGLLEEKFKAIKCEQKGIVENKQSIVDQVNIRRLYTSAFKDVESSKILIESCEKKIHELNELLNSCDSDSEDIMFKHVDMKDSLDELSFEVKQLGEWFSLQSKQVECEDSNKCGVCGLELKDECSKDNLDKLMELLRKKAAEKFSLGKKFEKIDNILKERKSSKELTESQLRTEKVLLDTHTKTYEEHVDKLSEVAEGAVISEEIEGEMINLNERHEELDKIVEALYNELGEAKNSKTLIDSEESKLSANSDSLEVTDKMEHGLKNSLEEELSALGLDANTPFVHLQSQLDDIHNLREVEKGRVEQTEDTLNNISQRLSQIDKGIESNENKLKVVEELKQVKEILSRKGLPRRYVERKFQRLSLITAENLAILNSDFTVDVHPDEFNSFVFERFDGTEQVRLPMSKMSGGQKVRLCIAFLLAVQQELVTEVGFQTFDEPSTHLDEEGVDRLCHLFQRLQELLNTAEHQVWVCDHNPVLEGSFNKTLTL